MRQLSLSGVHTVADLALSPDGRTLAVAQANHGLALYDASDGRPTFALRGYFTRLAFREDGQRLLASTWYLALIDLSEPRPREIPLPALPTIDDARFRSDGRVSVLSRIADRFELTDAGLDSLLVERGRVRQEGSYFLYASAFGPGSLRFGYEGDARHQHFVRVVVDVNLGRSVAVASVPQFYNEMPGYSTHCSRDDWFAFATTRELAVYNWADLAALESPVPQPPTRRGIFRSIIEGIRGRSADAVYAERFGHLPTLQPRVRVTAEKPSADALPVAFLPDGSGFLCRGANSAVELRDTATGQVRNSWRFQRAWPRALAVAPDGLTAVAAVKGGTVVFWDLE